MVLKNSRVKMHINYFMDGDGTVLKVYKRSYCEKYLR